MPTQLEKEYSEYREEVAKRVGYLKWHIDARAPKWLKNIIDKILYHPGTPWFCLGMGFEALGLSVQALFQVVAYPIFDAIISFLIGYTILYYHEKQRKKNANSSHQEDTDPVS